MKPKTDISFIPNILTIAGSDSSGGAGIQADIKSISANGGYACSVITALTAQNTQGVLDILPVPETHIEHQLDAVFQDIHIDAVKIGMLPNEASISIVAQKLRQYQVTNVVLDPVMVATSGDELLASTAVSTLMNELFPLATVITPNWHEAAVISKQPEPKTEQQFAEFCQNLRTLDTPILLKGGHSFSQHDTCDVLLNKESQFTFHGQRIDTSNTHGTGCTLSSAIATYLGHKEHLVSAISLSKHYITQSLNYADRLSVGHGHGPVNHMYLHPSQRALMFPTKEQSRITKPSYEVQL